MDPKLCLEREKKRGLYSPEELHIQQNLIQYYFKSIFFNSNPYVVSRMRRILISWKAWSANGSFQIWYFFSFVTSNTTFSWILNLIYYLSPLRGYCTPNLKLACFVCYLKIIITFFWKIIYASYSKSSKELKNGIEILVGRVILKLWIKTVKILLWSITQKLLCLLKF